MVKTCRYNDTTQLSPHFNVQEFRCKCGQPHDILISTELVDKLEQLFTALDCSAIVINSGHRCSAHDKAVGGSGTGQHVNGNAVDIVCYDKSHNKVNSKYVCCVAQDIGFGGIANIDSSYTATHVDVRTSNFWKGDEVKGTSSSVTSDFYAYYGLTKSEVYPTAKKDTIEVTVTLNGKNYSGILTEK